MTPFHASRSARLSVCTLAVVAACSATSPKPLPLDGLLPLGTWGGDSAGLIVSDSAAHVHIACTFGDVPGRIPFGAQGQFDVAGSYVLRAYPITVGPSLPARFTGRLEGTTVVMTVTVADTVEHRTVVRGPVVVRLGDAPRLGPCPICRRPIRTGRSP
jgi:hypothetical protein